MSGSSEERTRVLLRLPPELKRALEASAATNRRSLTREIQVVLEQRVAPTAPAPEPRP
jgi:predicted HicB family RNase H-like nuclease